jgi:SLT domain-containing protein
MTTLLGDARIRVRADLSSVKKDLSGESRTFVKAGTDAGTQTGRAFGKARNAAIKKESGGLAAEIKSGFKDAVGGIGAALAVVKVADFFKDSIKAATDLNETQSKAAQIFGKSSGEINKWASNSAKSFGLSRAQAIEAAASFGDMFLQLGFTSDQALKTSESTVQLAADLGSFNNVDPSDVLERIQAGYRGEYDSLQKLIPNINAARVEQEALALTHKKSAKELTAADKAMAVNAIITKDGARAAGDFARTSGGLANQQRIMAAQFEDTKAKLGQGLLPVMTGLAKLVNNTLLPAFNGVVTLLTHIPGPMYAAIGAFVAGRIAVGLFGKAMEKVNDKGGVGKSFKAGLSGIVGLLGGPWGIALGVGTTVLGYFLSKQAEGKQRVEDLSQTLDRQTGAVTENTRSFIAKRLADDGVVDKAKQLGLNLAVVTDAAMGQSDAMASLKAILVPLTQQFEYSRDANGQMSLVQSQAGKTAQELMNALEGQSGELKDATQKAKDLAAATATSNTQTATGNTLTAISTALTKAKAKTNAALTAALKKLNDALQASNNQFLIMRGAENGVYAAMDDLTASIKENGRTLDVHTAKGRANRQALDQVATAALNYLSAQSDNVKASPRFAGMLNDQRNRLITAAQKFGLGKEAAKRYADQILHVPTTLATKVDTPGLAKAKQDIKNLGVQIQALKSKNLEVVIDSRGNALLHDPSRGHGGMKTGGYVSGPGTATSDSIHAMLSDGEFVVNAKATKLFAPLLEKINGFAAGGRVARSIHVNTKANMPSTLAADIIRQLDPMSILGMGGGNFGGSPGSAGGASRWSGLVLQVLRMLGQSAGWLGTVLSRMNRESGGNPNAINLWDSNAKAGYPSQGLMQTIPGTFNAYAGPFRGRGIRDPLANIYAGLNYAIHRYGTLAALNRPGGYANGTNNATRGWKWVGENGPELMKFRGGEQVVPNGAGGHCSVQVFIGERELTDIVDVRVTQNNNRMADALRRGRR